ncbi:MAG: hypothetical protein V4634_12945 [Pseudomonadota bacterium]
MMAITSLVFVIPMTLAISFIPGANHSGYSGPALAFMIIFVPIMYLVMGYVTTAIACAIYNFTFKFVGGIEYETVAENV